VHLTTLEVEEVEIIPGQHSDTRIRTAKPLGSPLPLPLAKQLLWYYTTIQRNCHTRTRLVPIGEWPLHVSPVDSSPTPGVFHTCFYNHAHLPRLEKLLCLYLEISRIPNGHFKVLLDPDGDFTSETAARRFQLTNGRYVTVSETD
jgi:hypothetical protein